MQVSTTNMSAFWLSLIPLISAVGGYPSFPGRSSDGFSLNTLRNTKYSANGIRAKQRAIAKYAHLVESDLNAFADGWYSSTSSSRLAVLC